MQLLQPRGMTRQNPLFDDDNDPLGGGDQPQPDEYDLAGVEDPQPEQQTFEPSGIGQPSEGPLPPAPEGQAQKRYRDMLAKGPSVYETKKPNLWQKIAAAGTGAATGFYNASNPRSAPIDSSSTIEGILYPGQKRKQQQYEQQLKVAGAQADQETNEDYQRARIGELKARQGAEGARTGAENARAANLSQTPTQKYGELLKIPGMTPDIAQSVATTGKFPATVPAPTLSQIEGGIARNLQKDPNSADYKTAAQAWKAMHPDKATPTPNPPATPLAQIMQIRARTDMTPEQQNAAIEQVKKDTRDVAVAQHIPGTGGSGEKFTGSEQDTIERRKNDAMSASSDQLDKDVAKIMDPGGLGEPQYPRNAQEYATTMDQVRKAVERHRTHSQRAQNTYEQSIKAQTGKPVQHFELPSVEDMMAEYGFTQPKQTANANPATAGAPQGTKDLDENTAMKYLQQADGDKKKARELAKKDGYRF